MNRASLLVLLALLLCSPGRAEAGNDDTYFMSGEAALMGGAVVAVGGSAGMLWYNPAGLGTIQRNQYDVSLSGGAYQRRLFSDGLQLRVPGPMGEETISADLDGSRGTTIAPAAVYARRFGEVTLAAGFFTSRDEVIRLSSTDSRMTDGRQAVTFFDVDIQETRYHIGGGLGFELAGGVLKLGAAVFAVYDSANDSASIGASLASLSTDERSDVTVSVLDDSDRWALAAHLGAQIHPTHWLQLGVTIRLPMLLLTDNPDNSSLVQVGVQTVDEMTGELESGSESVYDGVRPAAGVGPLEPMRLMLGAGLTLGEIRVGVGFDYSPPLKALDVRESGAADPTYLVDRTSVWNLRAGALFPVSETIDMGFGVFTDRSAQPTPESLLDFQVDYYGGTFGIRTDTPVRLATGEHAETLVFRTTIALRYAYGTGRGRAFVFDLAGASPLFDNGDQLDVHFHELYAFIGSSLMF